MDKFLKNRPFLKQGIANFVLIFLILCVYLFLFTDKAYADSLAIVLKGEDAGGLGIKIKGIWQTIINLCNGLIIVVLIVVAFSQILRLNINTYGIKKILPVLIMAIIAANFSLLFCRLLVDFSSILSDVFINGVGPGTKQTVTTSDNVVGAFTTISEGLKIPSGGPNTPTGYTFGTLFWHGIGNLMILAAAVVLVILAYLFLIRLWMIYFLVSIAPLAIMSIVLPQTKSLFNQWWTNFSKWVFMPIVSLFWIWLGAQWIDKVGAAGTFMSFVFAGVCLYLAVTTPFKMGGAVMGAWGKIGKTAWGQTGGRLTAFAGREAKERGIDAGLKSLSWLQRGNRAGRFIDDRLGQRIRSIKQRNVSARQERLLRAEGPGMVRKKMEDDAKVNAAGRLADSPRTPDSARSRYRALQRAWTLDELKSSEWQNATANELMQKLQFNPDGTFTTPWNDPTNQMNRNYTEGYGRQMAALEQLRKIRRTSRDPAERQLAETMLQSIVTPSIDGSGNLINALDMDTHGYGTSAVGTPQAPASIVGNAEKLQEIAGEKTAILLERTLGAADMRHLNVNDLMGDMPENMKAGVMGYLHGIGEMIEKQMEATGGKESIEGLDKGFYRVKAMLFKPDSAENKTVDKLIEQVTKQMDQSQLPGGQENLKHALRALELAKSKGYQSFPMADFEKFKNEMVDGEISKQRMAIANGSSLGHNTINSLASVGANVPLENLNIDTALSHLNRNIEQLAENTGAPMSDMREVGIGAIADREAFKGFLKDSQSGLKEDLKGAMQSVFSQGITGKDTLSNPIVAQRFAEAISTKLSQRLSKAPLRTQVTNMPKSGPVQQQPTTVPPPQPPTPLK